MIPKPLEIFRHYLEVQWVASIINIEHRKPLNGGPR